MLGASHLSLCPLPCIYCVAPERRGWVKEGGGEYELMSCCREEPHTNIVRAGQEGEKDSGEAQKQKGKENAHNRGGEILTEKREIARCTVKRVECAQKRKTGQKMKREERCREVKDRQARLPLTWV